MKICLVTSVYALSDTDRHAAFLVESTRHLIARGHDVVVFAPAYEGCPSHTVDGVPVHRFRYFPRRWENLTHGEGAPTRVRRPFYLFVAVFYVACGLISLLRLCHRERFGLLHVHWPFPHGIWACAVSRLYGIPVVLTFHGAELLLSRRFPFVPFFLRRALRCARGVICNSTFTARQAAQYTNKRIEVVPFGITVAPRKIPRQPDKPAKDILFVGRLIERKGVCHLIRAIPEVLQSLPAHLHIVGLGPQQSELAALVDALGIHDSVTFHGVISNERLEGLYGLADVFVLPAITDSRGDTEGQGVVLVEAMSFGVPVIASDVGGIPDVVLPERTGLLVPEGSPDAIAAAIQRVMFQPGLATKMSSKGAVWARTQFSWDRTTDLIETVYARALPVSS